ncbi:hypothetical protein LG651_08355 [Tamlana sp. 62-3]|uniref:Uncharacterized protein n=1 Tax=Neotamlana sargassicola TaxID=2883125 RepID=A0A9X1I8U4_9FLAO|nr:hypothetical protein [Tamlana sargassicola]MCB4808261.1 hypothetical protein [Tamlana sargassicola]
MKTKSYFLISTTCACAIFFIASCISNTSNIKTDRDKIPSQTISYKEADVLEEEFKKTRAEVLNKHLGFVDAREFLFSLDSLKQYIAFFEREAKKQGYTDLGIRIYFGAYPESKNYPDPGRATVFLMPTGNKVKSQGSAVPFTFSSRIVDDNIEGIPGFNYGHAGKPPRDID